MKNTKKLVALLGNWRISDSQQHQRQEVRKSRWITHILVLLQSQNYIQCFLCTLFFLKKI